MANPSILGPFRDPYALAKASGVARSTLRGILAGSEPKVRTAIAIVHAHRAHGAPSATVESLWPPPIRRTVSH